MNLRHTMTEFTHYDVVLSMTEAIEQRTSPASKSLNIGSLIVFLFACFAVAATGAFFPPDEWYRSLIRPSYAPPNWVFGPVWSLLYTMMGISGWLVWKSNKRGNKYSALSAFVLQLMLNGAWSGLFFGWHRPDLALIEIVLLWVAIAMTIMLFSQFSRVAALLLLPYLAWVSFASVLNYGFWSLNH